MASTRPTPVDVLTGLEVKFGARNKCIDRIPDVVREIAFGSRRLRLPGCYYGFRWTWFCSCWFRRGNRRGFRGFGMCCIRLCDGQAWAWWQLRLRHTSQNTRLGWRPFVGYEQVLLSGKAQIPENIVLAGQVDRTNNRYSFALGATCLSQRSDAGQTRKVLVI